ncbi:MAG: xanthine dehydrogenase family protein molybdopterin-binding subunit [Deltaproteobacteria bacterium]|nr:xanthine dehydrogenase family protein molybdopterin-binding subunit [Deltaproteobacteria bacterium]
MPARPSLGVSLAKIDALAKVTGRAIYAADRSVEGMLHVHVVRSQVPYARIRSIGLDEAKTVPGVVGVWIAEDLPGAKKTGPRVKDEPVLCSHKVLRVGDPVVLIAGESERAARSAAMAVRVDYEACPPTLDPQQSLDPGASQIHPDGPNLVFERKLIRGDVDKALSESAHVIENTYQTQMIEHAYLEPEAGFSRWEGDRIVVELPTKHAHFEQNELAAVLDLPAERVRIICTTIGGYFGDKQCLSPGYYSAIVTRLTGRPARMVYTREESFFASTKRHPYTITMTTGADAEGRLTAAKVEIVGDTGAYASYGPSVMTRSVVHATGPYDVPNVYVRGRLARTNNPTAGAMRGFGVAQLVFAHETQMEILARAVGKSSEEIRRLNLLRPEGINASGQRLSPSVGIIACLDEVLRQRAQLPPHPLESHPQFLTAWGLAAMYYGIGLTGLPNPGVVDMYATPGKKVRICVGTGDGGQGAATTLVQIAAEALGIDPSGIHLLMADTLLTPNSGTSTASRITYVVGRAVVEACREMVSAVGAKLSEGWGVEARFDRGSFVYGDRRLGFREAVDSFLDERFEVRGIFDPPTTKLDPETGQGSPYASYAFAVHTAQVAVDRETGSVRVLRLIAAHDVGKTVNPTNAEAQVHGGVVMGLGYGLMEEVALREGRILNPGFRAYLVPSILEVPEIKTVFVEFPEPTGPFGAKGLGEPALLPTAPAIHNAVSNAIGRPLMRLPITAEAVWSLMKGRDA